MNLQSMLNYSIKKNSKIKQTCNPLKDDLGITNFTYGYMEADGNFCLLSNNIECLESFLCRKLYLSNPYFKCPSLFRSGYGIIPTFNPSHKKLKITHLLYLIEARSSRLELFVFGFPSESPDIYAPYFLEKLDLLHKFILYFRRECKSLIAEMPSNCANLKEALGPLFFAVDPATPLLKNDPALQFLKKISPLSEREQQCVEMYKEGHSAQSTAMMLGLSQRTIEHYFDNIKDKIGCTSKRDLLNV